MKILIVGIPGTGKTSIGNFLRDNYSFQHIDFETNDLIDYLEAPETFLNKISDHTVITWGFPGHFIDRVLGLKDKGFLVVWFDGNRSAAFNYWKQREEERGNFNPEPFYRQLEAIDSSHVIENLNPVLINPFLGGVFRDCKDITAELLKKK